MFKKSFDHFMWVKVVGKLDNMKISSYGAVEVPSESIYKFSHSKKVLDEHGVEYPDWKKAKEVLEKC